MTILEIFRNFTVAIANVDLSRSSAESAADREYRFLLDQKKTIAEVGLRSTVNLQNMFFQDASSGRAVFYGFRNVTIDEAIHDLIRHTNRQHQWFLAEAYELFEEFVKRAYAFMGMQDPTLWPLRDFGAIQWNEIQSKDYQWYLEQARAKRDSPLAMLRQFRKVLPRMASVEVDNRQKCDLQVAVTLVGHMRHQIVHARGIISDMTSFAEDLVRKLGHSGKGMAPHLEFVAEVLVVNKEDGEIHLLNLPASDSSGTPGFHYDIFNEMVRYLLVYAHQVYLSLGGEWMEKFEEIPPLDKNSPIFSND